VISFFVVFFKTLQTNWFPRRFESHNIPADYDPGVFIGDGLIPGAWVTLLPESDRPSCHQ
jgi:hypothetical protein